METILYLIQRVLDFWDVLTRYFDPELLPMGAYVICSAIALSLWWFALSLAPERFRRLLWALAAAILISPTVTAGGTPQLAPANVGMLYGLATENALLWQTNLLVMVLVFFVVLVLQQLWLEIRAHRLKPASHDESTADTQPNQ